MIFVGERDRSLRCRTPHFPGARLERPLRRGVPGVLGCGAGGARGAAQAIDDGTSSVPQRGSWVFGFLGCHFLRSQKRTPLKATRQATMEWPTLVSQEGVMSGFQGKRGTLRMPTLVEEGPKSVRNSRATNYCRACHWCSEALSSVDMFKLDWHKVIPPSEGFQPPVRPVSLQQDLRVVLNLKSTAAEVEVATCPKKVELDQLVAKNMAPKVL